MPTVRYRTQYARDDKWHTLDFDLHTLEEARGLKVKEEQENPTIRFRIQKATTTYEEVT
jgi:hypothetical protein